MLTVAKQLLRTLSGVGFLMATSCHHEPASTPGQTTSPSVHPQPAASSVPSALPMAPPLAAAPPAESAPSESVPAEPLTFPTRTVDQDPGLLQSLDLTLPLDPYLLSTAALRRQHQSAAAIVATVRDEVRSKRWSTEIRTGCLFDADGNVTVSARQIVLDPRGRVRALSQSSGTGDSAGEWKFYYDTSGRIRLLLVSWRNVHDSTADVAMSIAADGQLEYCSHPPDDSGEMFCDNSPFVEQLLQLDPKEQFARCETPYKPAE